jgi:hypothetical protein
MKVCKVLPYRFRDVLDGSLNCQSWHELRLDERWIRLYRALLIELTTDVEAFVKEQITKKYPSHE